MNGLPRLTHLQYLVITLVWSKETTAQSLREKLAESGVKQLQAGFVQMMRRMEAEKLVHARFTPKQTSDGIKREKRYKASAAAMDLAIESKKFYGAVF